MKVRDTDLVYMINNGNGILEFYYKKIDQIDLEIAKELVKTRLEFSENKSWPCLIDITKVQKVAKEARDYLADKGNDLMTASAIVVSSPIERMLVNFFIRVNKPKNPTKMFNDKALALKWLEQYIDTKHSSHLGKVPKIN